jgi:hypothetical protein
MHYWYLKVLGSKGKGNHREHGVYWSLFLRSRAIVT